MVDRPLLIAIDGYDGSGKSTLVAELDLRLRRHDLAVASVGRRGLASSTVIETLTGLIMLSDGDPSAVTDEADALIRIARIHERLALAEAAKVDVVLFDRWIPSDLGQLTDQARSQFAEDYRGLISRARVDLTIYLEGSFDTMWARVIQRGQDLSAKEKRGFEYNRERFERLGTALEMYVSSGASFESIDCEQPAVSVADAAMILIDPILES